jgi:hypothetical protein
MVVMALTAIILVSMFVPPMANPPHDMSVAD